MKPSMEEMDMALSAAEMLRDLGDPEQLGKALLYLDRRVELLEDVFEHAMRYVQFGLDEQQHKQLLLALEKAREQEVLEAGGEVEVLGGG